MDWASNDKMTLLMLWAAAGVSAGGHAGLISGTDRIGIVPLSSWNFHKAATQEVGFRVLFFPPSQCGRGNGIKARGASWTRRKRSCGRCGGPGGHLCPEPGGRVLRACSDELDIGGRGKGSVLRREGATNTHGRYPRAAAGGGAAVGVAQGFAKLQAQGRPYYETNEGRSAEI